MAKRFIDTGLFEDEWFMDLSKDAKILWIYFITKCDHAGILKLNNKMCQIQTGIKDIETVREQLGNRTVTVREQLFFIPKFVEFQYPGFPDCKFNTAKSAIAILEKYGLIINSCLTVPEQLGNSTGNGNGNNNNKGVTENFVFKNSLLNLGIEKNIVNDWIEVRKKKKAANTETAFKSIKKQIELSGASANDCIKKAVEKSWCGFEAEWYKNSTPLKDIPYKADSEVTIDMI